VDLRVDLRRDLPLEDGFFTDFFLPAKQLVVPHALRGHTLTTSFHRQIPRLSAVDFQMLPSFPTPTAPQHSFAGKGGDGLVVYFLVYFRWHGIFLAFFFLQNWSVATRTLFPIFATPHLHLTYVSPPLSRSPSKNWVYRFAKR